MNAFQKKITEVYLLGKDIEKNFLALTPQSPEVIEFEKKYHNLINYPETEKIGELASKILTEWNPRHFSNFLIPLERMLPVKVTDSEILVSVGDSDCKKTTAKHHLIFIAENIRSAFNIGSLFRQAECLGAEAIYLTGYSPTPETQQVKKTAMNCDLKVSWRYFSRTDQAILDLKQQGYSILALETVNTCDSIFDFHWPEKSALLLGNERFGILPDSLKMSDSILQIPLFGEKNSLNVATSAAVSGFAYLKIRGHL